MQWHLVTIYYWWIDSVLLNEIFADHRDILQIILQKFDAVTLTYGEAFVWLPQTNTVLFHPPSDPSLTSRV